MIHDVAIIGAGQAGLASAHHLRRRGLRPVVLDGAARVGDAWRRRYDSLKLFTPAQYSNLPGLSNGLPPDHYLSKDEFADYLERYAASLDAEIRLGTKVMRQRYEADGHRIDIAGGEPIFARAVVVATSALNQPFVPDFADKLSKATFQIHSARYRNPAELRPGSVLVVGLGNSGSQIAEELCRTHRVHVAMRSMPKIYPQRFLGKDLFWWLALRGDLDATADVVKDQPLAQAAKAAGRVFRPMPLIGSRLPKRMAAGDVTAMPYVTGADAHAVMFADGTRRRFDNIVWASGFRFDFGWIDPAARDGHGYPRQQRGITPVPGLAIVGLPFLHTRGSTFIGRVGRDADHVAEHLAAYVAAHTRAAT